ncbi:RNA binding protein [Rhynchospora pubera]|uniref:RNA binding protein n=1 Tax=Rhynchospora pubera TaxID=906938 RepID=A0AAV8E0U8_9POAL|nr:RNA binding protein [Rhynchospora pubera]
MVSDKDQSPPATTSAASAPSAVATNVLFVKGLPWGTTDAEVMSVMGPLGALDCVVNGPPNRRCYAFVLFRSVDVAQAAMAAAQDTMINGSPVRIEVARPAKAVRCLWVGGISASVTKEELEKEFSKFGAIENFAFLRNRNAATVDYVRLEDAISAHKNLNGKVLGGEEICAELCVDFQRVQPFRREPVDQNIGSKGWASDGLRGFHDPTNPETKRYMLQGEERNIGNHPTNVLWIGYPPNVKIDEQLLHNAMILFGEIERIKCFPERRYAFVEFRSTDEARRAKEGLQGRLFNDPRIRIVYSNSGARPDYVTYEESFASGPPPVGRGYSEPEYPARRGPGLPPGSGILAPPSTARHDPVYDDPYDEREAKRMRWDERYDRYSLDEPGYGNPMIRGGSSERRFSPGLRAYGEGRRSPDDGSRWRGAIHKGGSFVCNARCVPIGRGIDFPLPHVINCSARTDLETLTQHYYEATGFDAIFFLPDSEADFASYTEFLQYLSLKNRAGVAKMYDGTSTLFLVPPSEFLTDVLGIRGPQRLYGIVLHLPQQESPQPVIPQPTAPRPNSLDREELRGAPQAGVSLTPELISSLQALVPALATTNSISNGNSNVLGERGGLHVSMNQGQLSYVPANGNVPGGQEIHSLAPYMSHQPYQPDSYNGYMNTPTRPSNSVPAYQPDVVPAATATSELDTEKNQRYQSTLQFAANLLLQIQQQQSQQTGGAAPQ